MLAMACSGGSPPAPEPTTAPTATPEPAAVASAPADAQPTPTETPEPTGAPTPAEPAATIAPAATETTAPPPTPTTAAASPTVEPTATPPPPRATKTPEPCRFRKQVGDQTLPWVKEHHPQWPAFNTLDSSLRDVREANRYREEYFQVWKWHQSIWDKDTPFQELYNYYLDKQGERTNKGIAAANARKVSRDEFPKNMGWAVMTHEENRVCYWAWHYDEDDKLEMSFEATHTIVDTIPKWVAEKGVNSIPKRNPGEPGYDPEVVPGMIDIAQVNVHLDTIKLINAAAQ